MKLVSHSKGVNEKSFEPYLEVTLRVPVSAVEDHSAILDENELVQMFGREMIMIIQQIKASEIDA